MALLDDRGILYVIADLLSLITIASCLVSKVPQIQTVQQLKSATGLSLNGLLMELCSYSVTMLYNFTNRYAFLSYMEYPILLIQEYVLVYVVLKYSNMLNKPAFIWSGIYVVIFTGFATGIIPSSVLMMLVVSCGSLYIFDPMVLDKYCFNLIKAIHHSKKTMTTKIPIPFRMTVLRSAFSNFLLRRSREPAVWFPLFRYASRQRRSA